MLPSLRELAEIAIENQPYILEQDLRVGCPLCYYDKDRRFVIRYPDGTVEYHERPCSPAPEHCTPVRKRHRA